MLMLSVQYNFHISLFHISLFYTSEHSNIIHECEGKPFEREPFVIQ